MGQVNENDKNKNRKYPHLDKRVHETYAADSTATLRNKLSDPYVKAFRLASDRVRASGGVIAYITNNSFIDQIAFDGMRKHLERGFSKIYLIDLGGNVRKNPKLSGTTHNVFGIQVGVSITVLIKHPEPSQTRAQICYARMPEDWRRGQKTNQLERWGTVDGVKWREITPDTRNTWLTAGQQDDYSSLLPLGNKIDKGSLETKSIFRIFSLGVASNRDSYVYNSNPAIVRKTMRRCIELYSQALALYKSIKGERPAPDAFVSTDDPEIKWTRQTKESLRNLEQTEWDASSLRPASYRPFRKLTLYFQDFWNEERYKQYRLFPNKNSKNVLICINQNLASGTLYTLATDCIPDLHFTGDSQCFPFFAYDEDGTNCRENITNWALEQYREHYGASDVTKWDIFHYTYALLHHPEYRTRYAANLKRELPRIPMAPNFPRYAEIGAAPHDPPYRLRKAARISPRTHRNRQIGWKLVKMSRSKDKSATQIQQLPHPLQPSLQISISTASATAAPWNG